MKCHEVSHTLYTKFKNLHESFKYTIISRIKFIRSTFVQCAYMSFLSHDISRETQLVSHKATNVENQRSFSDVFRASPRTKQVLFLICFSMFAYRGKSFSNSVEPSTNPCRRHVRCIKIIRTDEPLAFSVKCKITCTLKPQ